MHVFARAPVHVGPYISIMSSTVVQLYKCTTAMQADHDVGSPVRFTVDDNAIIAWQKHSQSAF